MHTDRALRDRKVPVPVLARRYDADLVWLGAKAIAVSLSVLVAGCIHSDDRIDRPDPYAISWPEHTGSLGPRRMQTAHVEHAAAPRSILATDPKEPEKQSIAAGPALAAPSPATPSSALPATESRHTVTAAAVPGAPAAVASDINAPQIAGLPKRGAFTGRSITGKSSGVVLLEQARALYRAGRVLEARERFSAAMAGENPARMSEVLTELGRTYDPVYLAKLPRSNAKPDLSKARAIYIYASESGSKDAAADLLQLGKVEPGIPTKTE